MDANSDGKIDKNELRAFLQRMGYSPPKSIIENIIWEVDEDHDGQICLVEFENSYQRCSTDANGTEPRQLYNVILFLLHSDGAGGAKMSAEEAARLMYLQFGRVSQDVYLLLMLTELVLTLLAASLSTPKVKQQPISLLRFHISFFHFNCRKEWMQSWNQPLERKNRHRISP